MALQQQGSQHAVREDSAALFIGPCFASLERRRLEDHARHVLKRHEARGSFRGPADGEVARGGVGRLHIFVDQQQRMGGRGLRGGRRVTRTGRD